PAVSDMPPYRRGPRSMALYREFIEPYTGRSCNSVSPDEPLRPDHVVYLATPILRLDDGRFRFDDPMHPFELEVSDEHQATFRAVVGALRAEPAITLERLWTVYLDGSRADRTLEWMLGVGALMRTRPLPDGVPPQRVPALVGEVLFSVQEIDREETDLLVYRSASPPQPGRASPLEANARPTD
ncbi:MAG: hypothetical protein ACRENU_15345, partial [Gemmatimonadaceae bacterium]